MKWARQAAALFAKILVPLTVATIMVVVLDVLGYFFAPESYTAFAPSYRKTRLLSPTTSIKPAMARGAEYPRYYFRADDVLGFDINPGAQGVAEVDDHPYQIFANQLGCFDRNELREFQQSKEYFYFAGDSFTWGYASYENKFPTVWERETGKMAAKCGVTNTGQFHQFEKFKRVAGMIGKFPKAVFVGFYINDPANDLAHPHTTVIGGYQVDTAFLKDGAIVRPNLDEVRQVVENSIREMETKNVGWIGRLPSYLWVYSLTANLLDHGYLALKEAIYLRFGSIAMLPSGSPTPATGKQRFYYSFPEDKINTLYATDPRADANKAAITQWSQHAKDNSYRLIFLLIPPKNRFNDLDLFVQVREYLDLNKIEYVDFAHLFSKGGYKVEELYWQRNGHWNENGNQVVGRILSALY